MARKKNETAAAKTGMSPTMLFAIAAAILIVFGWLQYGQGGKIEEPAATAPVRRPAARPKTPEEVFRRLVREHPSPEVRAIEPMLADGRVRFATHYVAPEVGEIGVRDILYVHGNRVFVATPWFLTSPEVPPCVRTVALRHEVQHLLDDLADAGGPPLVVHDTGEADLRRHLLRLLHSEWRAGQATRALEKETECRYLSTYGMDERQLCAEFRRQMLTDGFHFPKEFLAKYAGLRRIIETTDCASFSGPP